MSAGNAALALIPTRLDAAAHWLNQTYAWLPSQAVPPYEPESGHVQYEYVMLAFARADAYENAGSVRLRHEQYDRFCTSRNNALGKFCDERRNGRHDDRPVRHQIPAWPRPTSLDGEPGDTGPAKERASEGDGSCVGGSWGTAPGRRTASG